MKHYVKFLNLVIYYYILIKILIFLFSHIYQFYEYINPFPFNLENRSLLLNLLARFKCLWLIN